MDGNYSRLETAEARRFRRTGVAALWKKNPLGHPEEILLVRSAKAELAGEEVWLLPQGGIGEEELLVEGLLRELSEELGIKPDELGHFSGEIRRSRLTGRPRSLDPKRNQRDKEYILLSAVYIGTSLLDLNHSPALQINKAEIAEALWLSRREAAERILRTNQPAKADFLLSGIEAAYQIMNA